MIRETFTRTNWVSTQVAHRRLVGLIVLAALMFASIPLIRSLTIERKHLLFDLGIAAILCATLYIVANRSIAAEARRHRRTAVAILIGVTAATAALGIIAVSLSGTSIGAQNLPALIIIQLVGATLGTTLGFPAAIIATLVVDGAARLFGRTSSSRTGAWIGVLTGLVGGLIVVAVGVPHLGGWFASLAMIVCGTCGYRAAGLHQTIAQVLSSR